MTYQQIVAGIYWAWFHGGEGIPRDLLRINRWAENRDLQKALDDLFVKKDEQPTTPQLADLPTPEHPADLPFKMPDTTTINVGFNPAIGRSQSYQALCEIKNNINSISIGDVSEITELYNIFLFLFGVSCYACHYPDNDIPVMYADIEKMAMQINDRVVAGFANDEDAINTIAWRIIHLTPTGKAFFAWGREHNHDDPLPELDNLLKLELSHE